MVNLTIGGESRELRFARDELLSGERDSIKAGGRPVLAVLGTPTMFSLHELECLVVAAWQKPVGSAARARELIEQFYREGGTMPEMHTAVVQALWESGVYVRPPMVTGNGHG